MKISQQRGSWAPRIVGIARFSSGNISENCFAFARTARTIQVATNGRTVQTTCVRSFLKPSDQGRRQLSELLDRKLDRIQLQKTSGCLA